MTLNIYKPFALYVIIPLLEVHNMLRKKDLMLLASFRQDARMSLTDMSKKTRVPISTIFDKLKTYQKEFIKKHTTLVDFSKLGYNTRAKIAIKVKKEQKEDIKEYLSKNESINSIYKINNGFDFLIEGIFVHVKDMQGISMQLVYL